METTRLSPWFSRLLAASLALIAGARCIAAVVVEVTPSGISVQVPVKIGASGAAAPAIRSMILPAADFARNLSFQMDRVAIGPTAAASIGALPAKTLPQSLSGALQAQVLAGIPYNRAVATQNILVQALSDPKVLAAIQKQLRRTATPQNPTLGRDAAKKLASLAAAAQSDGSSAKLVRYARELNNVLAASLAGDDREFSRLFDGLLSRTDVTETWPEIGAGPGDNGVLAELVEEKSFARRHARLGSSGEAITVGKPLDEPGTIAISEWHNWTDAQWSQRLGKRLRFADDFSKTMEQEVLSIKDFNRSTRNLIVSIKGLSMKPKFTRRAYAGQWEKSYRYYADLLARNKEIQITDEELRAHVNEQTKPRPVEIGAWRVSLKDGRVLAAVLTSSQEERIENHDFLAAINGLFASKGVSLDEIGMVQFFHTHPGSGPLSDGDLSVFEGLNDFFAEQGLRIPVHWYAVASVGERLLVFHVGRLSVSQARRPVETPASR
ncbi:MAG TPA: hypothetical protein DEB40_05955 [Elusimicrobia bacterium]|nr:hypothetical protein [Elusimicrobiota bacterium]HBT61270.1 hypothetical protein [Elusimicrobiota bacterium]